MACTEEELLTELLNFGFQKGWITESEKLRIETKKTLKNKTFAMLDVINTMEYDDNATRLLLSMRCIREMNTPELTDGDVNGFLPKIMFKLFEKRLVTQQEMSEFKGLLPAEEKIIPQENDMEIDSDDGVDDTQGCDVVKNPLQINVVIQCILQYMNFEKVKESRLISKEWASAGLTVLIPLSKITFHSSSHNIVSKRRGPIQFFQVFPEQNEDNRTFPFSHFKFSGNLALQHSWPREELNDFFRIQKQYITNLEFSNVGLVHDFWEKVDNFDITPWISNSPMAMTDSEINSKLFIKMSAANLSVDSNAISNVKDLELYQCTVNLIGGIQISPIHISIKYSTFTRNGSQLVELCVNDFVDFSKAKSICLKYKIIFGKVITQLSLDLNGRHEMDYLKLSDMTLINWKTSNWTIDQLVLCRISVTERTQMQIKKLRFEDSQIDISVLPQSLEELYITDVSKTRLTASQPIVLHNLKCLIFTADGVSTFFQNATCPNLVRLDLEGRADMDLAWLTSTSLKILRLKRITIKNEESRTLNLDKLELRGYWLPEMNAILRTHIQTKELVLTQPVVTKYFYWEFSRFLETQKHFQDLGQRIYICVYSGIVMPKVKGPVDEYYGFKYYVFGNNVGKGMKYEEFMKLCPDAHCNFGVKDGL